jgi:hypothetical protein
VREFAGEGTEGVDGGIALVESHGAADFRKSRFALKVFVGQTRPNFFQNRKRFLAVPALDKPDSTMLSGRRTLNSRQIGSLGGCIDNECGQQKKKSRSWMESGHKNKGRRLEAPAPIIPWLEVQLQSKLNVAWVLSTIDQTHAGSEVVVGNIQIHVIEGIEPVRTELEFHLLC